jgi:hypothetical protein
MFKMYQDAARCWWALLPALLILSALMQSQPFLLPAGPVGGYAIFILTLGATGLLMWFVHRHLLYGETPLALLRTPGALRQRPLALFLLVFMALNLVAFIPATLIHSLPFPLFYALLYLVIFSLFGTALPAAIDADPRFTLAKGLRQAPLAAWLLLAGPGLTHLVLIQSEQLLLRPFVPMALDRSVFIAVETVKETLGFLPTILAAAAFCHVYRRIVPAPQPVPAAVT